MSQDYEMIGECTELIFNTSSIRNENNEDIVQIKKIAGQQFWWTGNLQIITQDKLEWEQFTIENLCLMWIDLILYGIR